MPSGSQIVLDAVARDLVLDNVRQQVSPKKAALVSEIRAHHDDRPASYLEDSGRGLEDILRTDQSWTTLCRDAGKLREQPGPRETELVKRVRALAHVDDRRRWKAYNALLEQHQAESGVSQARLEAMLYYSITRCSLTVVDSTAWQQDATR